MFLDEVLQRNRQFVAGRAPAPLGPPETIRLAVLACYDPRLDPLIRPALGLAPGEGFLLRTAGARLTAEGDPLRSFALAVYLFGVTETLVLGHTSCRMAAFDTAQFIEAFRRRGVQRATFGDRDLREWAGTIASPRRGVEDAVAVLAAAPNLPADLSIAGLVLDDATGALEVIVRPEEAARRRQSAASSAPSASPEPRSGPPSSAGRAAFPAVSGSSAARAASDSEDGATDDIEEEDDARLSTPGEATAAAARSGRPSGPSGDDPLIGSIEEFLGVLASNAGWASHVAALRAELAAERDPLRKLKLMRRFLEKASGDARAVRAAFERVEFAARARGRRLTAAEAIPLLKDLFISPGGKRS